MRSKSKNFIKMKNRQEKDPFRKSLKLLNSSLFVFLAQAIVGRSGTGS